MFDRIFSQSSGRVVAIARLSLVLVSLIATVSDPSASHPAAIELVLAAYAAFSAIVVWLVWNDWWTDSRIAAPAHAVDMVFFMIVVLWPEGYASPYYLFFVFLLLSAAIRWGWRATASTAAVVIPVYLVAGLLVARPAQGSFELQRFIIRSGYLFVLSAILIWFGLRRRFSTGALPGDAWGEIVAQSDPPFHAALRHAKRVLRAHCGMALWTHADGGQEAIFGADGEIVRLSLPGGPVAPLDQHAFLFSITRDRALLDSEAPRPRSRAASALIDARIREQIETGDGLAVPVRNHLGYGAFFFWSIDALHSDHLELGQQLSGQLAQLIEHQALIAARQEGAIARERMSLARDLHDGIVQFLAGSTYRIEAISRSVPDRPDTAANLQDLKELMLLEQEDLRTSIAALRTDHIGLSQVMKEAHALCDRLARHWQIDCRFEASVADAAISPRLHLDILHVIREAIANAARHSSAKTVDIQVAGGEDNVVLTIEDDGASVNDAPVAGPWSIRERVEDSGGAVSISSGQGTKLIVQFPLVREHA